MSEDTNGLRFDLVGFIHNAESATVEFGHGVRVRLDPRNHPEAKLDLRNPPVMRREAEIRGSYAALNAANAFLDSIGQGGAKR